MLLPGTRQWKAADGVYIAVPFVGQDNPPLSADYIQPLIQHDGTVEDTVTYVQDAFVANNVGLLSVPTFNDYALTTGVITSTCVAQHLFPQHQTGAIFTGLSATSTLTLTVNYYLESFPGPAEPGILVLATPSAQYDPVALELFSHCLGTLPVGVPAGDNIMGSWFSDAVNAASTYLGPIASAMGYNGIAKGLKVASSMASGTYMASQSPQGQPRLGAPKGDKKPKLPPGRAAANSAAGGNWVKSRERQLLLDEIAALKRKNKGGGGQKKKKK
jgi:hypothetical protein